MRLISEEKINLLNQINKIFMENLIERDKVYVINTIASINSIFKNGIFRALKDIEKFPNTSATANELVNMMISYFNGKEIDMGIKSYLNMINIDDIKYKYTDKPVDVREITGELPSNPLPILKEFGIENLLKVIAAIIVVY